ncbi:unnamed protein product [Phaedon cochleariae]|uniref:Regulatory protein zeste n=1 Tax=Phaedon cochleariae TaxID=80249 RepID=A0A9P0DUL8_PHACE|nr:unnamed protein product [Phaedon cochleariae]
MSLHEHTYKPYGSPSFKNSDEIRIAVNFQDLILDISESYIYIEGKFTPNDATKTCYLSNNALAFLFDEIRYEMGGEQVCMVRKPGITTTMKSMISYGESNMKFLETIGWGLDGGKQVLLDKASNVFSGKLPLKYLMGFAEDYCRGILNIKQELILIIARSFKNSYIGEVDADVEINKIEWKIRHVMPSDKQKLKLLTRLNRSSTAKVKIAYRMWDLYELPTIRETASDIWAVKTTNSLERPRYIIIGFQNTDNTDNRSEDITQFTHAGVSNIRLYLNSEVYPYERWNLDFDKKLDAVAYYAYDNFQRSYYGKDMSEPMMSIEEFRKNPLFIIDCNHQPDAMKSSTVDINVSTELHRQANMTESVPSADVTNVSLNLPQFWKADPTLWFAQVEAQFNNKRITSELTKFNYVIASIDPENENGFEFTNNNMADEFVKCYEDINNFNFLVLEDITQRDNIPIEMIYGFENHPSCSTTDEIIEIGANNENLDAFPHEMEINVDDTTMKGIGIEEYSNNEIMVLSPQHVNNANNEIIAEASEEIYKEISIDDNIDETIAEASEELDKETPIEDNADDLIAEASEEVYKKTTIEDNVDEIITEASEEIDKERSIEDNIDETIAEASEELDKETPIEDNADDLIAEASSEVYKKRTIEDNVDEIITEASEEIDEERSIEDNIDETIAEASEELDKETPMEENANDLIAEGSEEVDNYIPETRPKKLSITERRNLTKKNRLRGKQYTGYERSREKIVAHETLRAAKKIKERCSHRQPEKELKNSFLCSSISQEDRKNMFSSFWKLGSWGGKKVFVRESEILESEAETAEPELEKGNSQISQSEDNFRKKKSLPITNKQKKLLTEYITQKPEMYIGRLTSTYTKSVMIRNWEEISNILNSVPNGPAKDWKQWRKTWVDIKKNTKARAVKERNYRRGTGGGPPWPHNNKDESIDEKILSIIPSVTIEGDKNVSESVVFFSDDNAEMNVEIINLDEGGKENYQLDDIEEYSADHMYCNSDQGLKEQHKPATTEISGPKKVTKKVTKSARLQESLKTNNRFIDMNGEKFRSDKLYQEKKIALLESQSIYKKVYLDKKLSALQSIANSFSEIASDIRDIKNKILENGYFEEFP